MIIFQLVLLFVGTLLVVADKPEEGFVLMLLGTFAEWIWI